MIYTFDRFHFILFETLALCLPQKYEGRSFQEKNHRIFLNIN